MKYVTNTWYVACWSDEVRSDAMFHRKLLEQHVVFYRKADGMPVALRDRCPHRFVPLHLGRIVGDRIECVYHGLQFDCTGKCVLNPHGDGKIPSAAKVTSYPVEDRHGMLWIWMGDAEADSAAIPDYSLLESTDDYRTTRGKITVNANYELIGENLLDLSHVAYLHEGLLGTRGMSATQPVVREEGTVLYVDREMPNVEIPGVFDMLFKRNGQRVDHWQNIRWYPPGCFLLDVGVKEPGGMREDRGWFFGIHILTPETAKTTHYHFASASPKGRHELDDESNAKLGQMRRHAFEDQDKPILDAQQAALGDLDFWAQKPVLLSVDIGSVRFRRRLEALVKAEEDQIRGREVPSRGERIEATSARKA